MHSLLLWEPIIPAACAVFRGRGLEPPYWMAMAVENVPGFGTDTLSLLIDPTGVSTDLIARLERTFEPSRQVEFAAIAVAGLALHAAGEHELLETAERGSAA